MTATFTTIPTPHRTLRVVETRRYFEVHSDREGTVTKVLGTERDAHGVLPWIELRFDSLSDAIAAAEDVAADDQGIEDQAANEHACDPHGLFL